MEKFETGSNTDGQPWRDAKSQWCTFSYLFKASCVLIAKALQGQSSDALKVFNVTVHNR